MAVLFTVFFFLIAQTITITVSSVTSLDSGVPGASDGCGQSTLGSYACQILGFCLYHLLPLICSPEPRKQ